MDISSYGIHPRSIKVPRDFLNNDDIRYILSDVLNDFDYEERRVIYFCCILDISISDVLEATILSKSHIKSVLNLYSARLENKLGFFREFVDYNQENLVTIEEMLFPDPLC
jgi:hypothetical protein